MSLFRLYIRVLGLLRSDKWLAVSLVLANIALVGFQFAEPILYGWIINALTNNTMAMPYVVKWAIVGFLGVLSGIWIALQADRLAHRRRLAAMAEYFEHVIALPASFHGASHSGRLMKAMLSGTDHLFSLWLTFFREHIGAIFSLIILVPLSLTMNWRLAILLFALVIIYGSLNAFVVRKTYNGQDEVERHHVALAARAGDVFGNVAVVQAFTRLSAEVSGLKSTMEQLLKAQYPVLSWWAVLTILTKASSTLAIVSIFALGVMLHDKGQASVGDIITFVGFSTMLIGKLEQLTGFVSRIFFQTAGLKEFFAMLDAQTTVPEASDAPELQVKKGTVSFENVSFLYGNTGGGVKNLNFTAHAGQTVALVGTTGAGKTTALALLQRANDPTAGRILIDGQDIKTTTLTSLRRAIAIVFQDAGLFSRSIAENLRMGKPDASDEELNATLKKAQAAEFIARKEYGINTQLSERGSNLSGGERQRLSIARAMLKDAPILILDEATSALDVSTEAKVQKAFNALAKGRTTFIIAHRLSTIRNADLILVLDQGEIVERGTFDELVRQGGVFANMASAGGFTVPKVDG